MQDGLSHALVLDGSGAASELDWAGVHEWNAADGPLWLHLAQQAPQSRTWLGEESGLEEPVVEALLAEETRPRATQHGQGLVLILRGVNLNPGADPEDMVSLRLWCDGTRIVSTRMRTLMAVDDVRAELRSGEGPQGVGELIARLAERLVARMEDVIAERKDRIDDLEEAMLDNESRTLRPALTEMQREAVLLRRHLAPQAAALQRVAQETLPWLGEHTRSRLRESADAVMRYVEDLDAMRDRAALVQEALTSRIADRMESRMYTLTIIATLFLPATFLTGLLGINVGGIPGSENPSAFLVVCIVLLIVCGVLLLLLRRRRWV